MCWKAACCVLRCLDSLLGHERRGTLSHHENRGADVARHKIGKYGSVRHAQTRSPMHLEGRWIHDRHCIEPHTAGAGGMVDRLTMSANKNLDFLVGARFQRRRNLAQIKE